MTTRYTTAMAAQFLHSASSFLLGESGAVGVIYESGGTFLPFAKDGEQVLWLGAYATQEAAQAELDRVNNGGEPDRAAQRSLEWDLLIG